MTKVGVKKSIKYDLNHILGETENHLSQKNRWSSFKITNIPTPLSYTYLSQI